MSGRDGNHRCKKCGQKIADKKHYIKNRKNRIINASKWNKDNIEKRKKTTRAYLESEYGKNKVNEKQRRNYWKNPEYKKLKNKAYHHGLKTIDIIKLFNNQPICKMCGINKNLSIDHMHPQSHGGTSSQKNLQVLCLSCNVWKSDKLFLADGSGYLVETGNGR